MSMRVRVVKNRFPQVIFTTRFQGNRVAQDTAEDMEENAKRFVPVLFGFLQNSISTSGGGGDWTVSAQSTRGGADREYANYVEYGTRHMAAQPFMQPAFQKGATVDVYTNGIEFGRDVMRAAR